MPCIPYRDVSPAPVLSEPSYLLLLWRATICHLRSAKGVSFDRRSCVKRGMTEISKKTPEGQGWAIGLPNDRNRQKDFGMTKSGVGCFSVVLLLAGNRLMYVSILVESFVRRLFCIFLVLRRFLRREGIISFHVCLAITRIQYVGEVGE